LKVYFRVFGWTLVVFAFLIYFKLWIDAWKFISEKIGSFFALILLLFTNIVGPIVYIVWQWIDVGFPSKYFYMWIAATVILIVGNIIKGSASDE